MLFVCLTCRPAQNEGRLQSDELDTASIKETGRKAGRKEGRKEGPRGTSHQ